MYSWISLIPTALVLILACITQNINKSLAGGIICAALIVSKANVLIATQLIILRLYEHITDGDNIALYLFLITTSTIVTLFLQTNTVYAVAQKISQKIHTKKAGEYTSFFTSIFLSVDDYLSILTTGFILKPFSDQFHIAATRLAFFIHSLAGPLVIMSPLSTWASAILLQLDQSGIHTTAREGTLILEDPFLLYLQFIPYLFYPLLTVFTVWYFIHNQIALGEKNAQNQTASLPEKKITGNYAISDIVIPIVILIVTVFIGFLYSGGYSFFNDTTVLQALQANDATFIIMFLGSAISFLLAFCIALYKKNTSINKLPSIMINGFLLIKGAVIMIILASIFSVFIRDDLHTGAYLANLLLNSLQESYIPIMIFLTASLITLITGSAWGTFAILLPIIIEMLISLQHLSLPTTPGAIYLLLPSLGALFSGAVCGDHLSPFSETTIMTATATGITPLKHARTQLIYMLPTICVTIGLFLLSGFTSTIPLLQKPFVLPLIGAICIVLILQIINRLKK